MEFEEKVEVSFEEVNDTESGDFWMSLVLFYHDVYGIAPPVEHEAFVDYELEELGETGEKCFVLDESFVVAQVSARWRL